MIYFTSTHQGINVTLGWTKSSKLFFQLSSILMVEFIALNSDWTPLPFTSDGAFKEKKEKLN